MGKLELKHLVGYLPYGLSCVENMDDGVKIEFTLDVLNISNVIDDIKYSNSILPILRQLSDLKKEIEVNGEKFVPIEKLRELYFKTSEISNGGIYIETLVFKYNEFKNFTQDLCYTGDNNHEYHRSIGYKTSIDIYEKLYEWHFDIHGLIENNLAIDINTL